MDCTRWLLRPEKLKTPDLLKPTWVPAWCGFVNKYPRGTERKHRAPSHCSNEHIYRAVLKSRSLSVRVSQRFRFYPTSHTSGWTNSVKHKPCLFVFSQLEHLGLGSEGKKMSDTLLSGAPMFFCFFWICEVHLNNCKQYILYKTGKREHYGSIVKRKERKRLSIPVCNCNFHTMFSLGMFSQARRSCWQSVHSPWFLVSIRIFARTFLVKGAAVNQFHFVLAPMKFKLWWNIQV